MKKIPFFLAVIFSFSVTYSRLVAQDNSKAALTNSIAFAEKIYLQLNSTVFTSDQTIWFKAIVTNTNQNPTSLSNVLHVDLINFDKKIIASKLLKIENGAAYGFFELPELAPLAPGKYLVRAYTQWNKNFKNTDGSNQFISKQYVDIFKPRAIKTNEEPIREVLIAENADKQLTLSAKLFPRTINPKFRGKLNVTLEVDGKKQNIQATKNNDKEKSYSFKYVLPENAVKAKIDVQLDSVRIKNFDFKAFNSFSKTIAVDKNFIDLQFFPEGGKLVNGLTSKIGFKALDYKNEGLPVQGIIKDNKGKTVTQFKSNQLGMVFFELKADSDNPYQAVILLDNKVQYKFNLPKVYQKGYVLTAKQNKKDFTITIKSNNKAKDSVYIKALARGITYDYSKLHIKEGKLSIIYNKSLFPEGIVTFTVYNKSKQPVCERLLFNYKKSNRLKITTKTDKKRYRQRDKIIFDIHIKNKDSLSLPANTSFLAINKKQLGEMQLKRNNILSYFLLQSELKGTIEKPSFYFDTNNKHRFYAMDALLLTQGWRNYVYQPIEGQHQFKIAPEKSLQISGSIQGYEKRKRKKPIQLTLVAKGKNDVQAKVSLVDSLGRFYFNLQDLYNNDLEYIIQTQNHKGKKREYSVNIDRTERLPVHFKKQETLQLADKFDAYVKENTKRYAKEHPFSVGNNGFALDEVVVKTRLLNSIQEKMNEEHGEPDVVIENEELVSKQKKWSYGLFGILLFNYGADIQILNIDSKTLGSFLYPKIYETDFTFVIVDGKPVIRRDFPLLEAINTEEVKSLEMIKFPKLSAKYFLDVFGRNWLPNADPEQFSFLNIYSHSGIGLYGITSPTIGIMTNKLPSFSVKKEFYAPKHEQLTKSDWDLPDLRSTIFWKPNVEFDKNGNTNVAFYNDDNIGEILVIIESIAENGKIGYYETTYKVYERLFKREIE